jgi:hypothetical protein
MNRNRQMQLLKVKALEAGILSHHFDTLKGFKAFFNENKVFQVFHIFKFFTRIPVLGFFKIVIPVQKKCSGIASLTFLLTGGFLI